MLSIKLDEIPDEGLDLKWKEERASLLAYLGDLSKVDFDFKTPLQVEAKIKKTGKSVFIRGTIETTLELQCGRCLKEFPHHLFSTFELTLYPLQEAPSEEEIELEREEMESNFFEGGDIHLSEIACEQVFLEIPYQPLCQEGCRGLCPRCGKDLNASSCECVREEFPSGFSVLKKLKLD